MVYCILWSTYVQADNGSFLKQFEREMTGLVKTISPSIVTISAKFDYSYIQDSKGSILNFKDTKKQPIEITNIGSGFIIDSTFIITKTSVINGSQDIQVIYNDSTIQKATVLGTDPELGISIIQVDSVIQHPLQFGNSDSLSMGCWVMLMGNSMGIAPSVSFGIVNCIRKDDIFQVSTNVAAGNAGGAIFNTNGEMVGMLTSSKDIESDSPILGSSFFANETVFAHPSKKIQNVVKSIIERSKLPTGWIGVTAEDWPGHNGGVHISKVTPGGPAENAGLRIGDIILTINGKKINHTLDLANHIKFLRPGEKIQFKVLTSKGMNVKSVTVGEQPGQNASYYTNAPNPFLENVPFLEPVNQSKASGQSKQILMQRIDMLEQEIHSLKNMIEKR